MPGARIIGKDIGLALLSGVLLPCIFPAVNLGVLGWVCLVPMLAAIDRQAPFQGLLLGCLTGTVFHGGLLYWVTVAMSVYGGLPVPLSLAVLALFAVVLSLFTAAPAWAGCYVRKAVNLPVSLTLPFFWTASEFTKSWLLTGFPWENLGYSQFQQLPVIQIADITGVYGISFLMVLVNCTLFACLQRIWLRVRLPYAQIALTIVLVMAALLYGHKRLQDMGTAGGPPLKVAIVQPNITQDQKWDPAFLNETMAIFARLSRACSLEQPDLVIWPESATPFFYQSEEAYQAEIAGIVRDLGAHLLFGSPSWELVNGRQRFFNSAFLVAPDNRILGRYDKIHLVPYGEYVPLQPLFPFIQKMVTGIGDFSSGSDIRSLPVPACPCATLICYEIIFPDLVRRFVKQGARCIINLTNDAWFGRTSAPYQHLSMAVLRAVENRRYLARAAKTGISACISPAGLILRQGGLFTEEVLPAMIYCTEGLTFYTRHGDVFAIACLGAGICFLLAAYRRQRSAKKFSVRLL
jgi:apolipoprotein N-acyltransferase